VRAVAEIGGREPPRMGDLPRQERHWEPVEAASPPEAQAVTEGPPLTLGSQSGGRDYATFLEPLRGEATG
jgi:hypothetical protein